MATIPYDRNLPYNQLPLLPPAEDQVLTKKVLLALNKANKALAELKGYARKLPNQSMLVNTIALREAKASTEIENIFTTDDELYKALTAEEQTPGNTKEVLRYRQAVWSGFTKITEDRNFTRELIINVYREINETDDSIRPAEAGTVIKKRGSGVLGGTVVYTPPRGEKVITEKLNNLIEYLNDDIKYPDDPLIKLAISHYQFEAIHPFRDGNGRTGRILNILLMVQKQLLDIPILYLSAYIINNKDDYYALLNKVTAMKSWTDWILYILRAVEETSVYTISRIEEIDRIFEETLAIVSDKLPYIRKEVIEKLFEQPYISPKKLIDNNIKSINTAKKYLSDLEKAGILVPEKFGRETIYLNTRLFNLLADM